MKSHVLAAIALSLVTAAPALAATPSPKPSSTPHATSGHMMSGHPMASSTPHAMSGHMMASPKPSPNHTTGSMMTTTHASPSPAPRR